ncbi:MAG TPA: succinylglutamate desuccinylase/aspartoacylase family protein [Saprospiraceae bacterium]|nr:succinylglutamate desuccinylase/aspartoacylase family protein [Saprospiraceae bacterium]HMP22484.1 succinylglutamate desuccinylase/aspartoacylase family protein [Saprospiraceae bacterium]
MDDLLLQLQQEDTQVITELNLEELPPGAITKCWMHIVTNGVGMPVYVPVIVARGSQPGKTLGFTAALHGNELNGISLIQRLFAELNVQRLRGTVIGVPVVNTPALLHNERCFSDGTDLNQVMPGRPDGNTSEVYAHRILQRLVSHFDYLVDIHTASFGRVNSYFIRADLHDPVAHRMAMLQNAQIIIHNPPSDGTLRGAAASMGIKAVTLEMGTPNTFQKDLVRHALSGLHNLLSYLQMNGHDFEAAEHPPVVCQHSYWLYTDTGGILSVHPQLTDFVRKGEKIATLRNIFGDTVKEYFAPEDGIVVGKSVCPVNQTGGRILHLGVL